VFGRRDKTRLEYPSGDRLLTLTPLTSISEYRNKTNSLSKIPADLNMVQEMKKRQKLSPGDVIYALEMAIACAISYWIITYGLAPFVDRASDFLGGMWAAVATVFVFRDTRANSVSAGLSRLLATCVSFALCLLYLVLFPFQPVGMAALIGIGTVVMMLLGRREDIVTTGITTAVVMVVAAMSPHDAWQQPLLRVVDTVVGIAVAIACRWIGSFLFVRKQERSMESY
jgi:uncharacterized membrane protein YccC